MILSDGDWRNKMEMKIDRILNDIEFIKNRTSTYIGRNEVITYLPDETPIFVNSDDFGCPLNFINGGFYEEDYFGVFLSFRKPGDNILDIGANLGVYSIRMASYARNNKIHAFEPIPKIRNLFSRSSFLNGFDDRIVVHPFAVSDSAGKAKLHIPSDHAGGASIQSSTGADGGLDIDIIKLDDFFPGDFSCGLVKVDVEGHEFSALKGMRSILERSKQCAVMFEKLHPNSGIESDLYSLFSSMDWCVYYINGRMLEQVDPTGFVSAGGYFVAAPAAYVAQDGLERNFFRIYPSDLNALTARIDGNLLVGEIDNNFRGVIFHGPYWYLARGYYRLTFEGVLTSSVTIDICEKFGFKILEVMIDPDRLSVEFPVYRDLAKFEVVMRAADDSRLNFSMNSIKLTRLG